MRQESNNEGSVTSKAFLELCCPLEIGLPLQAIECTKLLASTFRIRAAEMQAAQSDLGGAGQTRTAHLPLKRRRIRQLHPS